MSIQESDTRLELNDFPDGNFERTYEDRMRQEPQGRGGFGERARAPRQASESHNPHDVMDMSLVRMDVALILEYDPRKKMFHAHLKSGDMADFLALSGDCSNKDMERCILSKVRVASCDGLSAGKWSLNIMDGASRKNQKSLLERKWGVHMGGRFNLTGIPVSLVGKDGKVVFDKDGGVSEDVLRYGSFSMERVTGGVLPVPERRNPHMLIPAFPNGMYFAYALSKCTNRVTNLALDDESEYLRVPMAEYEMVVDAYNRKLRDVESTLHNLSSLEIMIEPICPLSEGEEADCRSVKCLVCMEIESYMPLISV